MPDEYFEEQEKVPLIKELMDKCEAGEFDDCPPTASFIASMTGTDKVWVPLSEIRGYCILRKELNKEIAKAIWGDKLT
jgi:hypothetical protein